MQKIEIIYHKLTLPHTGTKEAKMSNTIDHCHMCEKKDFRPISPEPGLLIGLCSDHMGKHSSINCSLCGHHHHHPENQPACQEFRVLLTADDDELITWDEVVRTPVQEQNEHDHHGVACNADECMPCPGCGGIYDGYDYCGRGCSRTCAYGEIAPDY